MSGDNLRAARIFLASFLVLFLEIALIRWMPAYIRLLSYFSNFILLASFLGIGLGCLLAPARVGLFTWFPLLQAIVIASVNYFRLEVSVAAAGSIYFTSGTASKVVLVESWYPTDTAAAVARAAGAQVLVVPQSPGAVKGTDTYISHLDALVAAMARAMAN